MKVMQRTRNLSKELMELREEKTHVDTQQTSPTFLVDELVKDKAHRA